MDKDVSDAVRDGRHLMDHEPVFYRELREQYENAASWVRASESMGRDRFIGEVGPVLRDACERTGEATT